MRRAALGGQTHLPLTLAEPRAISVGILPKTAMAADTGLEFRALLVRR